MILPHLFKIWP